MRNVELNANAADNRFDEMPEVGDTIEIWNEEYLIVRVAVCNESSLHLKLEQVKEVKRYEDPCDPSATWENLSERFLENDNQSFIDQGGYKP
jgi:hypothetical protein